jgi:hypothetical protein
VYAACATVQLDRRPGLVPNLGDEDTADEFGLRYSGFTMKKPSQKSLA